MNGRLSESVDVPLLALTAYRSSIPRSAPLSSIESPEDVDWRKDDTSIRQHRPRRPLRCALLSGAHPGPAPAARINTPRAIRAPDLKVAGGGRMRRRDHPPVLLSNECAPPPVGHAAYEPES